MPTGLPRERHRGRSRGREQGGRPAAEALTGRRGWRPAERSRTPSAGLRGLVEPGLLSAGADAGKRPENGPRSGHRAKLAQPQKTEPMLMLFPRLATERPFYQTTRKAYQLKTVGSKAKNKPKSQNFF